jgi:hypothetical protein
MNTSTPHRGPFIPRLCASLPTMMAQMVQSRMTTNLMAHPPISLAPRLF